MLFLLSTVCLIVRLLAYLALDAVFLHAFIGYVNCTATAA